MDDKYTVKNIVARNLTELRQKKGMTQLELANLLNYSDKAVSKWERGESLPDIEVLLEIARLYEVSLDYLVRDKHDALKRTEKLRQKIQAKNHVLIIGICILGVWLIAALLYVIFTAVAEASGAESPYAYMTFIYSVPICVIVGLVLNSVWFGGKKNFWIVTLLMWSALVTVFLSFKVFAGRNIPLLFVLGLPGELIIFLAFQLGSGSAKYISVNRFDEH